MPITHLQAHLFTSVPMILIFSPLADTLLDILVFYSPLKMIVSSIYNCCLIFVRCLWVHPRNEDMADDGYLRYTFVLKAILAIDLVIDHCPGCRSCLMDELFISELGFIRRTLQHKYYPLLCITECRCNKNRELITLLDDVESGKYGWTGS